MKWAELGSQDIAILIPTKDFQKEEIIKHYISELEIAGIKKERVLVLNLAHTTQGKYPIRDIVQPWMEKLEKALKGFHIKHLIICEPTYFKKICKVSKAEPHYGYSLSTIWKDINGVICPNYRSLFFNPAMSKKISLAIEATVDKAHRKTSRYDKILWDKCIFPSTRSNIKTWIDYLYTQKNLACDIETYSLKVDKAGIASIAFAWDTEKGVAFKVGKNQATRQQLKNFFKNFKGSLRFHGGTFDAKILIYELFMSSPNDYFGMLEGLEAIFRDFDDTKILAYLAHNTTAEISYSLKNQAMEFAGNYALKDITNIASLNTEELLQYNVTDCLATNWIFERDYPEVMATQSRPYFEVFNPALKVITQMELCGMPFNYGRVLSIETELDNIARKHFSAILADPIILEVEDILRDNLAKTANKNLKTIQKTKADYLHEKFNPGSPKQLQTLLYEYLDLPIFEKTKTGQPSTSGKTLKALIRHLEKNKGDQTVIDLIDHIKEWAKVSKILNTFIPAFKSNCIEKDGWHYLHGSFNLGGTKSGRLSSSNPNLQNLPSTGTKYAKMIKSCFQAPPYGPNGDPRGWIMVGADFHSLEDRISALQTKDPNKLKVYTDGYDGHCLRAYSYFHDLMPDINPDSVSSINSIEVKYPKLRQESKGPTFLLTYMGTHKGLQKTFGFSAEEAITIETKYHDLYKVSDEWVMDRIRQAQKNGYVELAFGLKLRTPILPQVILESASVPFQAHKEMKTAGNALGQSYGLLNTRAANEFMQRVWDSEYRYDILPICQIHDSLYFMIRNTLGCLEWVNRNLIECMEWNKLPEIQHDTVKLGAELEIFYPDWSCPTKIPNNATRKEIQTLIKQALNPAPRGA
jgi:DNA polymerase-1